MNDGFKDLEKITQIIQQDKELLRAQEKSKLASDLIVSTMQLKEVRVKLQDISKYPVKNVYKRYSSPDEPEKKLKKAKTKVYEVERIVAKKKEQGQTVYLVKWKNWNDEFNSWEPLRNLDHCEKALQLFENLNSKLIEKFQTEIDWKPTKEEIEKHMLELTAKGIEVVEPKRQEIENPIKNYFKQKESDSFPDDKEQKLRFQIKQIILSLTLYDLRQTQLMSLNEWEKEMNSISKGKPMIRVENKIDLEKAPSNFFYIDEYLPGSGVVIPDEPPIGCECTDCSSPSDHQLCCFSTHGKYKTNYTLSNKVRVAPGTPIYECNKRCACPPTCPNRVVQRGACARLCVFRTSNGTGWGVKTLRKIKRGSFVIQYVGEVITNEEAEQRGKTYDAAGRTYLFDLDYNETEGQCPYTVDAAVYGNISHFINHSCDPNLAVYGVWINCLDPNLPVLALFATRDIEQNEEITFDYMCQSAQDDLDVSKDNSRPRLELLSDEQDGKKDGKTRTKCKCGSENCRQYIF